MLSVAMIVKNEEKYIYECLKSVAPVADEIVIVDTGSEDKTLNEIDVFCEDHPDWNYGIHRADGLITFTSKRGVKKYIEFFEYKWADDFSSARNESLKHCSGEWILYIDADERLSEYSVDQINAIKRTNERAAYQVKVKSSGQVKTIARQPRLFRNVEGVRFKNKLHEQIGYSFNELGFKVFISSININHIGYDVDEAVLKDKAKRNLELLLKDPELKGNGYHIAECYLALGDLESASKYYLEVLSEKDGLPKNVFEHARLALINIYIRLGYIGAAFNMLDEVERFCGKSAELYMTRALCYESTGDVKAAYDNLLLVQEYNSFGREDWFKVLYDDKYIQKKINKLVEAFSWRIW